MSERAVPLQWSTRALERVSEALDYISQYDSHASERCIEALFAKLEGAALAPRMGRIVPELRRDDIHEVFYKSYLPPIRERAALGQSEFRRLLRLALI